MPRSGLSNVVESRRLNAALAASIPLFLAVTAVWQVLVGDLEWAGFTARRARRRARTAAGAPEPRGDAPLGGRASAAFPIVARALVAGERVGGTTFTGRVTTYVAVAAVALLIAVELDVFTQVKMNHRVAIVSVVVTTMAAAGIWAVVRWLTLRLDESSG